MELFGFSGFSNIIYWFSIELKDSRSSSGGLIWVTEWDTLQYSIATAFLAVVFSNYMFTSKTPYLYCNGKLYESMDLREVAISQVS